MTEETGTLVGIAWREAKFAAMEEAREAKVSLEHGVANDSRGQRRENAPNDRQVTVVSAGAWRDACAKLGAEVPWTLRRANLLVEGIDLERSTGARLRIGGVELEVTGEVDPCQRMDDQHNGLTAALVPNWRGGVGCRIVTPGTIAVGDTVTMIASPAQRRSEVPVRIAD